jgi:hypothetical protein
MVIRPSLTPGHWLERLRQAQVLGRPRPDHAARVGRDVLRSACRQDMPAARGHVDQVVGGGQ